MLTKEEALEKAKKMSYGWNTGKVELVPLKDVNKLIREIYSIKPYKFENLKPGMWLWDDREKICNLIYETRINCAGEKEIEFQFTMIDLDGNEFLNDIFEEGRFFPLTKAMQVRG